MPPSSSGSKSGSSGSSTSQGVSLREVRVPTTSRARARASSSSAAKWSATPLVRVWTSAPPSSSAVTSSPVAAFTRGGPPRKIVPRPFTMTVSSLIAGT